MDPTGFQRLKYLWYVHNIILDVIRNKQDALEIQRVMQNFIKEEVKLNMKERKGLILNTKSKMAKYLGALVTYYDTKSVIVVTLALGSQPRQGFTKVWVKSELGSHISWSQECKRVWRNEPPHS